VRVCTCSALVIDRQGRRVSGILMRGRKKRRVCTLEIGREVIGCLVYGERQVRRVCVTQ
jgi:hypothetical protein